MINVAEGILRDARLAAVEILVDGSAEGRVKVNVVLVQTWMKALANALVRQPLLEFRRPHRVVYDALFNAS